MTVKNAARAALVLSLLPATLVMTACQTASQSTPSKVWTRVDGRPIRGDSKLEAEFKAQAAQCRAVAFQQASKPAPATVTNVVVVNERYRNPNELDFITEAPRISTPSGPNVAAINIAMEGCMAQRGYIMTAPPASQPR